jgi:hypothetical protein
MGVVVGLVLAIAGIGALTWAIRAHERVATDELQDLRARGLDDGLPIGASGGISGEGLSRLTPGWWSGS